MRLLIAAVGRLKDTGEEDLSARYKKRIDKAGRALSLGPLTVTELPEARAASAPMRKNDEATRLIAAAARADRRVMLDERGEAFSSEDFATLLRELRDEGTRELAFLIGGPDGHGDKLHETADHKLTLSAMTLPHGLARVLLLEQIYRAITILSGHPYHRP